MALAQEEDASRLMLGPDFTEAQCLCNSEVALLLENKQKGLTEDALSNDPVFEKTLKYVQRFNYFKGHKAVREVRQILSNPINDKYLHQFEIAMLANLCPDTIEEAKAHVQSLGERFGDDEIHEILKQLKTFKPQY